MWALGVGVGVGVWAGRPQGRNAHLDLAPCKVSNAHARTRDTTGLPEEMNITLHVLTRGYAAVAISSYDRRMSRWVGWGGVGWGCRVRGGE